MAVAKKKNTWSTQFVSFEELQKTLKRLEEGIIEPFYVLYGEEIYFKEQLIHAIVERTILPENRLFNYTELITSLVDENEIFKVGNRNQLGNSEYTLLVVREADNIANWEPILPLFKTPKNKGVVVLEFQKLAPKTKKQDDNFKTMLSIVRTQGLLFESTPPRFDNQVVPIVEYIAANNGCKIERAATEHIIALLGNSLTAIDNEIRKIAATLPKGRGQITLETLQELKPNREYTPYQLTTAIVERDLNKALTILYYMAENRNTNSLIALNAALFSYFQKVLLWGVLQRNLQVGEVARILNIKEGRIKEFNNAIAQFPPKRCARIIANMRDFDMKLKGVGSAGNKPYEQMKQLLISIITS